jgi:regulatory protein
VRPARHKKPAPPLDIAALERLALHYVGRYATTRAKLRSYLARKLRERGWTDISSPDLEALANRFAALGYVDDKAFADARAASLQRRGFGTRRISQALNAAGIEAEDAAEARAAADEGSWLAACRYAKRKRIGPYARDLPSREAEAKAFGAMLRAGHAPETIRRLFNMSPRDIPDWDYP